MEYRGARMQGPPPHSSFRPRGGRGNNSLNHHPVPNHHLPSQVQPRLFNMNQPPWNQQGPMNSHNTQQEGLSYPQPPYTPDTGYNYTYHQTLASPEPQSFPSYPPQMFIQPQVFMDPAVCYQSPPMVTTPPMAPPIDTPVRKFHFNNKDTVVHCSSCSHKNILAETEIIKRDERIDNLEKEILVFRKQTDTIMAENTALRSKLEALQSQKSQGKEFGGLAEPQKSVKVEAPDNSVTSAIDSEIMSDDGKKPKPLSPDAAEFSPKSSSEALSVVAMSAPATAEVPVVSAKGVMDEEGDAYTPVLGSEAGTQVEENLFEETSLGETSEVLAAPEPEASAYPAEFPSEDSTTQVQHENWSDEVDKTTAQEDSLQEPKIEQVNAEVAPVADETWGEEAPVTSSAHEQNWRENNSQMNIPPDHWQQKGYQNRRHHNNRGNRFRGQAPGFGRGKRYPNDQEQYNDNYRPNYSQNRPDQRGYGNQNNQNLQRFQRSNEETWDSHPKDQRDGQRYDGRNNRNQRYSERSDRYEYDHQKQSDEQETNPREGDNRATEKPSGPEKNNYARDHKDNSRKNREGNSDLKDMKESGPQVHGAWRGKDNSLNFSKDEKKETPLPRDSPNQIQGHYPNRGNRQSHPRVDFRDIVKEIPGDLFSSPGDFSLAHCVAQDFRMGSGIAVRFKTDFKRVGELLDQNVQVGGCAHLKDKDRFIFYLVTKEISSGKPRIEDLRESLRAMREKCLKFGVKKLAMPRIGCGLDKLDWYRVKSSIIEILQDLNMEIRIYDWNVERVSEAEGNKPDGKSTLPIRFRHMNLFKIARDTALIFLGTEDGYMDSTAISLNEKHHFEQEYKRADKTVGSVVCIKHKDPTNYDWVFSLIVAKSQKDKVLFTNIEMCCSKLSQLLRKASFGYAGIECPQGWSDDKLFFEKILTLFRATLCKSIELWVCYPSQDMDILKHLRDKDVRDKDKVNDK